MRESVDNGETPQCVPIIVTPGEGAMADEWAARLTAMYQAWFERSGYTTEQARAALAMEVGVHRLVDIGQDGRRQTCFAAVQVIGPFGSQVRSYVRQPYSLVRDLRTEVETEDVDGVLAGDIDRFLPRLHDTSATGGQT